MNLKNKVAIVTGASSGIGLAVARLLTQKGAKVVLAARSLDRLKSISKELPDSLVIKTDMVKEKDIKALAKKTIKHFGRVDILINNAGQGYDSTIEKIDTKLFEYSFRLNLLAPILMMKAVIPIMKKQGEGVIVNVSSGTAVMILPGMSGYSSFKRALAWASRTAREELKKDNIKVSVIYPYVTLTDFEKNTATETKHDEIDYSSLPVPPNTAEEVAKKLIDGMEKNEEEIFPQEWMRKMK